MSDSYLGIDIGTSGCKAVVFDSNGKQLASSYREYNVVFTENGGAELDSDEVIDKCFEVIKDCTNKINPSTVKAIGISSQGEAFTPIGFDGKTLHNSMVSSDIRPKPYVKKFLSNYDEDKLYRQTGHNAQPLFTLFKLLWFKDNKRELWEKTKYFLCFEDLLQYRLGLEPTISYCLAGRTMMFDVRKKEWSKEILDEVEITTEQLAKPIESGEIAGYVNSKIAAELGLSENTFVVAGGHDQSCSALGAGVIKEGIAMYATGTVECITPISLKAVFSTELKKNNLCTYNYTIKDVYTTVAFSLTGGNILKWFRDEFAKLEVLEAQRTGKDAYEIILNSMNDKPSNLLVLPYFTPSGTPYFDTETKGAILGLRLSTERGEIIKALIEGVALEMRLNLEILQNSGYKISELRAVGGGAKSKKWTQLKADVLNKKITTLNITEAGCLGAAMLACSKDKNISIVDLASEWVKPVSSVYPQQKNIEVYNKKYSKYKSLYQILKEIKI